MRLLINLANHLIRYARTRHLTITTRVSRFVYLLHTAPDRETTAPLLRNVRTMQPPISTWAGARSGTNFRRPDANNPQRHRSHPHRNRPHQLLGHLMPSRDLLIWAITGIWRMYTT